MKTVAKIISVAAMTLGMSGMVCPVYAQEAWSALPGGCASTENNFWDGKPSETYPVARFRVPGGALTHNASHVGYIVVICNVDNPRALSASLKWNQMQVTYRDPDGIGTFRAIHQAYVELIRVSKVTGIWSRVAVFDSNRQCTGEATSCQQGSNDVRNIVVPFTHTFDFNNFAYAVYGRLYRANSRDNLRPALYQLRLQAQQGVPVNREEVPSTTR